MAIKEQIDIIKNNINYTTNSMTDLKAEVETLKLQIKDTTSSINDKSNEFLKNFNENIDVIKLLGHDFEKELFQFKLLKAQMQKKIIEKFEEELSKELKIQIDKLNIDSEKYDELKVQISEITNKVNNLGGEINKFMEISMNIKREDFELTRFANKLIDMDKEKLELMRKIDTLERLVSKMRRQEFVTR